MADEKKPADWRWSCLADRPLILARWEKLARMEAEGVSQRAMGRALGISQGQVWRLLEKHRQRVSKAP